MTKKSLDEQMRRAMNGVVPDRTVITTEIRSLVRRYDRAGFNPPKIAAGLGQCGVTLCAEDIAAILARPPPPKHSAGEPLSVKFPSPPPQDVKKQLRDAGYAYRDGAWTGPRDALTDDIRRAVQAAGAEVHP